MAGTAGYPDVHLPALLGRNLAKTPACEGIGFGRSASIRSSTVRGVTTGLGEDLVGSASSLETAIAHDGIGVGHSGNIGSNNIHCPAAGFGESAGACTGSLGGAKFPQGRSPEMVFVVWILRLVLLGIVLLPAGAPLYLYGPEGYGQDRKGPDAMPAPGHPETCNGVVDRQYYNRGNPRWDEFGDFYPYRMVASISSLFLVSALTCVSTKYVCAPSAYVTGVRCWLFFNWLVATLWCLDRSCQWCVGTGQEALQQHGCGMLWNARQISWSFSTIPFALLVRMRVRAIESAQGISTYSQKITAIIMGQSVLCLGSVVCSAFRLSPQVWGSERVLANLIVLTVALVFALMLLTDAVLLIALMAFWGPFREAQKVVRHSTGRRREEARSVVHRARVHVGVTAVCAATSLVAVVCEFYSSMTWALQQGHADPIFEIFKTATFGLDLISNATALLFFSGLLQVVRRTPRKVHSAPFKPFSHSCNVGWVEKVTELSERGFTLAALIDFYAGLGQQYMLHFDPRRHLTCDVVRQAIIPLTAETEFGPCALATKLMGGMPTPAQRLVTHAWSNKFADLVAAIIADAMGLPTFESLRCRLAPTELHHLKDELRLMDLLQLRYWVCALSVNQHAGICGSNPRGDVDPVAQVVHPVCACGHPKLRNDTPPLLADGEGIGCEMNKFDEVMSLLAARDPLFRQVVVVDEGFSLFTRAWCIAEIWHAYASQMSQHLVLHSCANLDQHRECLEGLRVEDMESSRVEDKAMILAKIGDVVEFNANLRWMTLDESIGLLAAWRDALTDAETLGRIARRRTIGV